MRGRAAVAQAKLGLPDCSATASPATRWNGLAARGAHLQRPLWASTSTKNPAYPDTLYVDSLIGPDTVNTLPEATITAFEDHGTVARTIDTDVDDAHAVMSELLAAGIDMDDVGSDPRGPRRRRLSPVVRRSADHLARQSPPAGAAMIAPAVTPRTERVQTIDGFADQSRNPFAPTTCREKQHRNRIRWAAREHNAAHSTRRRRT